MNTRLRVLTNLLLGVVIIGVFAFSLPRHKGTNLDAYHLQLARQPVSEPIATISIAFVGPKGRVFQTDDAGHMRVHLGPTPSKNPPEVLVIYARATASVPTRLVMQREGGRVDFVVESLSPEGDFVIPCSDKEHCRRILLAAGELLSFELQPSHDG